jgi:galactokinase
MITEEQLSKLDKIEGDLINLFVMEADVVRWHKTGYMSRMEQKKQCVETLKITKNLMSVVSQYHARKAAQETDDDYSQEEARVLADLEAKAERRLKRLGRLQVVKG